MTNSPNPNETLAKKANSGLKWSAAERVLNQALGFGIRILLARILGPEEFGPLELVVIFLTLSELIVDSGLSQAIIQTKKLTRIDVSTIFFLNIVVAAVLYTGMWFAAPSIATYFTEPILVDVIRILMLNLFISAISRAQMAVLTRQMRFKKLFFIVTPAILVSGIIGVAMALTDFGVWALVGQFMTMTAIQSVLLWIYSDRSMNPRLEFSMDSLIRLGSFGIYILGATLMFRGTQNVYGLVIGKVFGTPELALFNRARSFQQKPVVALNKVLNRVLFPVLSTIQDDNERIKRSLRNGLPTLCFGLVAAMAFLMVSAEPMVVTVLTSKWLASADYLRIFPIMGVFFAISALNLTVLKAKGDSKSLMIVSLVKNAFGILVLLVTVRYGVLFIVVGIVGVSFIGFLLNIWITSRLIDYSVKDQLSDIFPYIAVAALAACVAAPLNWLPYSHFVLFCLLGIVFFATYLVICHLLKMSGYVDAKQRLTRLIRRRKSKPKPPIESPPNPPAENSVTD